MIDTKALRNKVLELAIQGKLTEQLESDGTAEELYQKIQAIKQKLIKDGKIKKEQSFPEIKEEEIPFEIPNNWKWYHFGEIIRNRDSERIPVSVAERKKLKKIFDYYGASGVIDKVDNYIFDKPLLLIGEDGANLLSRSTPIAFIAKGKYWVNNHAHVLDSYIDDYCVFIMYYINSLNLAPYVTGSAQPKLNQENMNKIPIPLPPLAEQKRIATRIEEIFKLLDIIDEAQKKYSDDVEILKSKLIAMGIQGKLTEQLESDGTAEELYQQIQDEKQKLIKEGKIKKEKALPEIKDEEIPFEIPNNWKWVRLGEIFQHNTGKALNSSKSEGVLLDYITTSNVYWNSFDFTVVKKMPFTESELEKCTVTKGDLLICEGGDIGRSAIWNYDYNIRIQNHLHRLRGYSKELLPKYYYYILKRYKESGLIDGRGIGLQGFSSTRVHNLTVPLPPLMEQKRIVDKLDDILKIIDKQKTE